MFTFGTRAHDYGKDTPENLFSRIAADGWRTVQLAFKKAIFGAAEQGITTELVQETQRAMKNERLTVGVLGAYIEPSLAQEQERQKQVSGFCAQIPVAAALSAGCIGTETTKMELQPGVSRETALSCLRVSLERMLTIAQQHDVIVGVEPVYYHTLHSPQETKKLLRDMKSSHLKVIFDPVNLLSPELVPRQHSLWEQAFDCFGDEIIAVHMKGVHCVDGRMVSCSLQESVVDYPSIFKLLNQQKTSLPILREETRPEQAKADLALLQGWCEC